MNLMILTSEARLTLTTSTDPLALNNYVKISKYSK
jgi:hypothetical protein